jgi:hypothetical protein
VRLAWLISLVGLMVWKGAVGGVLALISYPLTSALFIRLRPST